MNISSLKKISPLFFFFLIVNSPLFPQQIADTGYNPPITNPAYQPEEGPIVFIDEGHHNFHTKEGRYKAFSNLLERDGYQVEAYTGVFQTSALATGRILVISNALHASDLEDWVLPNPSAFTLKEIEILKNWVMEGGRLFLIADHMPMAGAAEELAKVFGFEFTNGFVLGKKNQGPAIFKLKEKTLTKSVITKGRATSESVKKIATFTGQAFQIPEEATPILTFGKGYVNMLPDTAWVFNEETTRMDPEGWVQGAYREFGKGRIVVFGEAAMFSAQLAGPQKRKIGMNNKVAPENHQLLLNIIHWLDGKLD